MFLKDEPGLQKVYSNLPRCMWILLMDGTLLDNTGYTLTLLLDANTFNSLLALGLFGVFILLSAMTVMNLLIGVICEVVTDVSIFERDEKHGRVLRETILLELNKFDNDGNGMISQAELSAVMADPFTHKVMHHLDVDVGYLAAVQPMLLPNIDSEASIESIMDLILACRGSLPVTVKHLVNSQTFFQWNLSTMLQSQMRRLENVMTTALCGLDARPGHPSVPSATPAVGNALQTSAWEPPDPPAAIAEEGCAAALSLAGGGAASPRCI